MFGSALLMPHSWLVCQIPTSTYAPKKMSAAPVARPSSPSVRLTAFDHAVMRKFDQTTNRMMPTAGPQIARSRAVSRKKDTAVEAGRTP